MSIMKKVYEEAAKTIQAGKRYTLFGYNDFGFPCTIHTTIHKAYTGSYAQYDNMLYIEHQPKRKRTIYKMPILDYQVFYLWEGWIDLDNEDFWKVEQKDGYTITSSNHMSFDKYYLREKVKNIKTKPIAILDRDYYTNVNDMEFIYEVVTEEGTQHITLAQFESMFNVTGKNQSRVTRIELQGQPTIREALGPMWGGYKDGKAVIRYETQKVYDMLSI